MKTKMKHRAANVAGYAVMTGLWALMFWCAMQVQPS